MKTTPIASPHAVQPTGGNQQSATDARARAIAKLTAQPAQTAVPNQTQISPEMASAAMVRSEAPQAPEVQESIESQPEAPREAKTEVKTSAEDQEKIQNQYQILARKERQLVAKQRQLEQNVKSREDSIKAKEAELQQREAALQKDYISKQKLKSNPYAAFEEAGTSYDEVTQQLINLGSMDPRVEAVMQKYESKINDLEKKLNGYEQSQTEEQTRQYQAAVKQIRSDVTTLVKTDPSFELIRATNSVKDVVDLIEQTWKEEQRMLSVEEAAQEVEEYLTEEADKLARLEKIKKRLSPPSAEAKRDEKQTPIQSQQQQQPMKTLTNSVASTRRLSARERAILAMEGKLK